ncbi:hypothetical protein [Pantoea agglomerans]|uniref:hypothetical protein n=1 Tax=Enterobacter agglomerans TaxID=549 RepID=UPI00177EADEC|nr:hypothetical protein [Pantoea agglomerans]MBD8116833.1 hypothetical protein [Pantoea agglomerans]
MNNEMKAALANALNNILSMTPDQLFAEVDKIESGDVYDFLMESGKFADFDVSELHSLQMHFSETMPEKTVTHFFTTEVQSLSKVKRSLTQVGYALAA